MRSDGSPATTGFALLLGAALLAACGGPPGAPPPAAQSAPADASRPAASRPASPAPAPDREAEIGHWRGTLPCVGCAGIDTDLTLYASAGGVEGPFRLVEARRPRRGSETEPSESRGEWFAERGTADDPAATVYRLEPGEGPARLFLAVGDDLEMLDHRGRRIRSRANLRLTLVAEEGSPAVEPSAAPASAGSPDGPSRR
jgi:uncharacterized lipoprotein NlpE involved in copper resistance